MSQYNFINQNLLPIEYYDFQDKQKCVYNYGGYMINRTQSMFRYRNLPETIPARNLELMIQSYGYVAIAEHNGELYAFQVGLGGKPNEYYLPTIAIVSNPALEMFKELEIDKECVIIPNDSLYMGLMPLHSRFATLMTEADISLRLALINLRSTTLISGQDDRTLKSAQEYLDQLEDGDLAVVAETAFLDGLKTQPYSDGSASQSLQHIIELKNSIQSMWLNELGLQTNPNQKSQYVNEAELTLPGDSLMPLIDDMLRCRKRAILKINEMFGTDIEVELNSAWEDNQIQVDNSITDADGDGETMDDVQTPEMVDEAKETENTEIVEEQNEQPTKSEEVQEEVEEEQVTESETKESEKEEKESEEDEE